MEQSLYLYKQNFKFSSGHFLVFDQHRAERLHGHNYQVRLKVLGRPTAGEASQGFIVDFKVLKDDVLLLMKELDEYVLFPKMHPDFKFEEEGPTLKVFFRERYYAFPKNEVKLLTVVNTSVEEFSRYLAERLRQKWQGLPLSKISVQVEETRGQAASTTLSF